MPETGSLASPQELRARFQEEQIVRHIQPRFGLFMQDRMNRSAIRIAEQQIQFVLQA
jgi:hypothetical protein